MAKLQDVQAAMLKIDTLLEKYKKSVTDDSIGVYEEQRDKSKALLSSSDIPSDSQFDTQLHACNRLLHAIKHRAIDVMISDLSSQLKIRALKESPKIMAGIEQLVKELREFQSENMEEKKVLLWMSDKMGSFLADYTKLHAKVMGIIAPNYGYVPPATLAEGLVLPDSVAAIAASSDRPIKAKVKKKKPKSDSGSKLEMANVVTPEVLLANELAELTSIVGSLLSDINDYSNRLPPASSTNSPLIKELWEKQASLFREKDRLLAAYTTEISSDALIDLSENDAMDVKVAAHKNLIEALDALKVPLDTNEQELFKAIAIEEKTRAAVWQAIADVRASGDRALSKIAALLSLHPHDGEHTVELVKAQLNITTMVSHASDYDKFIEQLGGIPSALHETVSMEAISSNDIAQQKIRLLQQIETELEPVNHALTQVRDGLMHRLTDLESKHNALESKIALQIPVEIKLSHRELQDPETTHNKLQNIKKALLDVDSVINGSNFEALAEIGRAIEAKDHIADEVIDFIGKQKLRQASKEVAVIRQMINMIDQEVGIIPVGDNRVEMLNTIKGRLNENLETYCTEDRTSTVVFIEQSINIIKEELSGENLNRLSDEEASPFANFIRALLKPICQLCKAIFGSGDAYKPQFFATPIETTFATAAKSVHKSLNEIGALLEERGPEPGQGSEIPSLFK